MMYPTRPGQASSVYCVDILIYLRLTTPKQSTESKDVSTSLSPSIEDTHRFSHALHFTRSPQNPMTTVMIHAQAYTGTERRFAAVAW